MSFSYRPYVCKADRQATARSSAASLRKKGIAVAPILIEGRDIAKSVWGKAWCDALESHADYENRLPRGRTYVRNGSVFHLAVSKNCVEAQVSGSEVYKVTIEFKELLKAQLDILRNKCQGAVASLSDLLAGRVPPAVMDVVSEKKTGLFPAPGHITFRCSCPDWASMCKHVAATLYGVGARLDSQPELLFTLRGVDHRELVPRIAEKTRRQKADAFADDELADVFGVDFASVPAAKIASAPAAKRGVSKPAPLPKKKPVPATAKKSAKRGSPPKKASASKR